MKLKSTFTDLLRISAPALIVFVDQVCPGTFVENTENYTLVGSNVSQRQYTYRRCHNQCNTVITFQL